MSKNISVVKILFFHFGKYLYFLISMLLIFIKLFEKVNMSIRAGIYSKRFKFISATVRIDKNVEIKGYKYITLKDDVSFGRYGSITAWENYNNQLFTPIIEINKGCIIGEGFHITAINKIIIGENVLIGKKVTITDNSHGASTYSQLLIPPKDRELISKDDVVIGNSVWIGDKATILPGTHIGNNAIIAANAVVTKDIPAFSVAAGIPAKVIKTIHSMEIDD